MKMAKIITEVNITLSCFLKNVKIFSEMSKRDNKIKVIVKTKRFDLYKLKPKYIKRIKKEDRNTNK
jgi:hypothetical protein